VLTNALTGCELGAAVGGADFNPANKSEAEIQRFCQSYMTELAKYIGPDQVLEGGHQTPSRSQGGDDGGDLDVYHITWPSIALPDGPSSGPTHEIHPPLGLV
jgi:hypothetical protein